MDVLPRYVKAIGNDVSRYGYITPLVFVEPQYPADYPVCIPEGGMSIDDQLQLFTLRPGDVVSVRHDPFFGANRLVRIESSTGPSYHDAPRPRCTHCNALFLRSDFGIQCSEFLCRQRLVSRMSFMGSRQGLSLDSFTPDNCSVFVAREQWFRSLDQVFEPSFCYRPHTVFLSHQATAVTESIEHLKRNLRAPRSFAAYCAMMSTLINSLSLPGFTDNVIQKFMMLTLAEGEDPIPFILSALEQPAIMIKMGISPTEASQMARTGQYYAEELGHINAHIFSFGYD